MKTVIGILMVLLGFFGGFAMAEDAPKKGPEIKVTNVLPNARITVTMRNTTKSPLKVWQDWNSWGAMNWRVLVFRNGQLKTYYRNPGQTFTVNFAAFSELAVGAHIDYELDLNGGDWCDPSHCSPYYEKGIGGKMVSLEPNDTIIVIYDVAPTAEAIEKGVWYGMVATRQVYPATH